MPRTRATPGRSPRGRPDRCAPAQPYPAQRQTAGTSATTRARTHSPSTGARAAQARQACTRQARTRQTRARQARAPHRRMHAHAAHCTGPTCPGANDGARGTAPAGRRRPAGAGPPTPPSRCCEGTLVSERRRSRLRKVSRNLFHSTSKRTQSPPGRPDISTGARYSTGIFPVWYRVDWSF